MANKANSLSHSIYTKVPEKNHIQPVQREYQRYSETAMLVQRRINIERTSDARPCAYACKYSAQAECITIYGISQREKHANEF